MSDVRVEDIQPKDAECPRCRIRLERLTHAGIKGAGCPKCDGVWLSAPALANALKLYAADQGVALKTIALLEGPARPSALPCPKCPSSTLRLITLRGVEVEKCVSCGGVFLDSGEAKVIANRVMFASATWEPAHQELMRVVRERLAYERAQSRADGRWPDYPGSEYL